MNSLINFLEKLRPQRNSEGDYISQEEIDKLLCLLCDLSETQDNKKQNATVKHINILIEYLEELSHLDFDRCFLDVYSHKNNKGNRINDIEDVICYIRNYLNNIDEYREATLTLTLDIHINDDKFSTTIRKKQNTIKCYLEKTLTGWICCTRATNSFHVFDNHIYNHFNIKVRNKSFPKIIHLLNYIKDNPEEFNNYIQNNSLSNENDINEDFDSIDEVTLYT